MKYLLYMRACMCVSPERKPKFAISRLGSNWRPSKILTSLLYWRHTHIKICHREGSFDHHIVLSPSSISMTACSSILALGMMPLCLLIYTSVWTSSNTIQIPYDSIGNETAHIWFLAHIFVRQPYNGIRNMVYILHYFFRRTCFKILSIVWVVYFIGFIVLLCRTIIEMDIDDMKLYILRYHTLGPSCPNFPGHVF